MTSRVETTAPKVDHYENFPVASWLCPPRLRPAVAAIYWFARTADDIADEGTAPAERRLEELADFRAELATCAEGGPASPRWPQVFGPLAAAFQRFGLPRQQLNDLLSAFRQDVVKTRDGAGYADRAELLDYCARSANPVGRLLLHLYSIADETARLESDRICTALQLINFWQDLGIDLTRGRFYLPAADCAEHGLDPSQALSWHGEANARRLLASEVQWARELMIAGQRLVHRIPGRSGWELRLVVQGGLRILEKIERGGFDTVRARPRLRGWDWPLLIWRALWM